MIGILNLIIFAGLLAILYGYIVGKQILSASAGNLRMQEIASLNLLYADKEDNIFFVHNMKSPIRNPDYDWTKVIPGDDSSLIWNEFYAFDDIPQVLNPESGYLFSANQNPFFQSKSPYSN